MGREWASPLGPIAEPTSVRQWGRSAAALFLSVVVSGSVVASLFFMDWFTARTPHGELSGFGGVSEFSIDLRSVSLCDQHPGQYCHTPLKYMAGIDGFHPYLMLSTLTLWVSMAFVVLVLFQVGSLLLTDVARRGISVIGYIVGILTMSCVSATAYVFGPTFDPFDVTPTMAPAVLMVGCLLGVVTLYYVAKPFTARAATQDSIPLARAQQARSPR